jgi:hypothetical protein
MVARMWGKEIEDQILNAQKIGMAPLGVACRERLTLGQP